MTLKLLALTDAPGGIVDFGLMPGASLRLTREQSTDPRHPGVKIQSLYFDRSNTSSMLNVNSSWYVARVPFKILGSIRRQWQVCAPFGRCQSPSSGFSTWVLRKCSGGLMVAGGYQQDAVYPRSCTGPICCLGCRGDAATAQLWWGIQKSMTDDPDPSAKTRRCDGGVFG